MPCQSIRLILPLLAILLIPTLSYAAEPIEQDVSSLFAGMDTSAIDGTAGSGSTSETKSGGANGVMMTFDFSYGSQSGLYGPCRFVMSKRNLKKLERKLAKDEAKLSRAGKQSMKVFVRIEMNRQLISKLKSHPNFKSGKGCKVYFDVAELYEKANTDPEYNKQLLLAAARTMGDSSLENAVASGSLGGSVASSVNNGVQSSVNTSVQTSVRSSVSSSVQQSVQNSVNAAASSEATNGTAGTPTDTNNPTGPQP